MTGKKISTLLRHWFMGSSNTFYNWHRIWLYGGFALLFIVWIIFAYLKSQ